MVADGNSAGAPIHAIARFHGRDLMRIREGEPVAERDHHGDRPEEDAPAEGRTAEELTPDTGKPVSKLNLGRFGAGFIFFCIVFMMSGTIGSTVLLPARFNTLGIGQGETILGTMNSIGIIFALISNVIFGSLSDASHSRFGKRTPWIIIGGPIAGIGFYLTSISPDAADHHRLLVTAADQPELHDRAMRGDPVRPRSAEIPRLHVRILRRGPDRRPVHGHHHRLRLHRCSEDRLHD